MVSDGRVASGCILQKSVVQIVPPPLPTIHTRSRIPDLGIPSANQPTPTLPMARLQFPVKCTKAKKRPLYHKYSTNAQNKSEQTEASDSSIFIRKVNV